MPTDTKLKELIINELTEEQYKALTPNDDELYLTPDGSVTKNENGSYVLDGDVDITGTTKLNGGIKPIHIYQLDGITKLYVIFESTDHDSSVPDDFMGYGWIERFGSGRPCIFYYALKDGAVSAFKGLSNDTIYEYNNKSIKTFTIAKASECQPKLYRHIITLTAGTNTYVLVYDCTNNTPAESIQNLRTLMKVSSASDSVMLPVVNSTDLSTAGLQVTTSICKIGTANVTAVSDSVTSKA